MTQAERDMQHALEAVIGGDMRIEAGCVMDKLETLGWQLTPAPLVRVVQEPLPLTATTSGLAKRRSS